MIDSTILIFAINSGSVCQRAGIESLRLVRWFYLEMEFSMKFNIEWWVLK